MEFVIEKQKVLSKTTEDKKNPQGKNYTLRLILFEDENSHRDSLAVFNKDIYMLAEEGKTYDLICKKNARSYIEIEALEEIKE